MPKDVKYKVSEKGTKQVADKFDKVDDSLKRMRVSTSGLQRAVGVLRNKLLLVSFAGGLVTKMVFNLVKESAKFESLEKAFINLGEGIGFTEESMNKLQIATNNTVKANELIIQANNAMLLGIVKSDDEMAQLFDTAQRLAKAVGQDAVYGIESLVTGLGRQSRLMLDNLGIIVDTRRAYDNYAKSINKTVKELTDEDRKRAFILAGMSKAAMMVKLLGKEQMDAADSIKQMKVVTNDLAISLGKLLTPALIVSARGVKNLVSETREFFDMINRVLGISEKIGERNLENIRKEIIALDILAARYKSNVAARDDIPLAILLEVIQENVAALKTEYIEMLEILTLLVAMPKAISGTNLEIRGSIEGFKAVEVAVRNVADTTENIFDPAQRMAIDLVEDLSSNLAQAFLYGQKLGPAVVSSLKAIAAELISKAAVFAMMNLFTGGTFGKTKGFLHYIAGFQGGGSFTIPGMGGRDSQIIAFRGTPGEKVTVETPIQQTTTIDRGIVINVMSGADVNYVRQYLKPAIEEVEAFG